MVTTFSSRPAFATTTIGASYRWYWRDHGAEGAIHAN